MHRGSGGSITQKRTGWLILDRRVASQLNNIYFQASFIRVITEMGMRA